MMKTTSINIQLKTTANMLHLMKAEYLRISAAKEKTLFQHLESTTQSMNSRKLHSKDLAIGLNQGIIDIRHLRIDVTKKHMMIDHLFHGKNL